MNESELIEQLADKEHESWARWMYYLFSKCENLANGAVIVPAELVTRWKRQTYTPYERLSETEKQSDRDEVTHVLPIIREYIHGEDTLFQAAGVFEINEPGWADKHDEYIVEENP